ncbi:Ankyrin-2 [Sticta canariensis]|nr:Ankyrin-2 [Sticta canariensis]
MADFKYRLVGKSLPWTAPEYKDTMSGKGILSTDLYCFGLLSWRILLNGHSPFDHISLCTPQTQGSREAKSNGREYFFNEPTVTSHDSEKPKRLNSVEIQDLKSLKGNELLRLAHSTTKTWPQWTSKVFVSLNTPEILGSSLIDERHLAHFQPGWKTIDVGQRSHDSASFVFEIVIHNSPRISERIGDRRQAIFTYKFPMYILQLRRSPVGFRDLVIHLFDTIAKADRPKSANKARAALCLAICHLQEFHPNSNKPEALQWLVTAAQEGDVLAQLYIQRLHNACQFELPPELIAQWLGRASDQGLAAAWMDLQKLSGHKNIPFRPYRILRKSLSSFGSSKVLSRTTPDGESLLHYAAATGMCEVVFAIGESDYNVDCKNGKEMTPLHLGCWNSQHSAIKGLLSLGADVNSLASGDITPLHLAVASLNVATVDILLDSNCDIDIDIQSLLNLEEVTGRQESYYSDFRGTALHWAVCRGLVDITEALLRRGADPTVENVDGYSAFSFAAMRHDLVMLKVLFRLTPLDKDTKNRISQEVTLEAGRAHSFQSMLSTGRPSFDSFTAIIRNAASCDEKALLSQAIEGRSVRMVKYLIEKRRNTKRSALIETYLYDDRTFTVDLSLNGVLWSSASNASVPLVKLLLSLGADPRAPSLASRYGGSILHRLASGTNIDCSEDEVIELVKLLVDNGVDINSQDPDTKSTPLHTAVFFLKARLVKVFLSCGADPLAKKANGQTPYLNLLTENYSWTAIDTLTELIEDPGILRGVFNPSDHMTNFFHILAGAPEMARDDSIGAKMCKTLVGKLKSLPDGQKLLRAHLGQSQPFTGFTPLHLAVSSANEEIAQCASCAKAAT